MEKLFVYGTLTDENVQQHIIGRVPKQELASIHGYKFTEDLILGRYRNIEPTNMLESVKGKLLYLTPEEIDKTDKFECVSNGLYERHMEGNWWVYYK